MSQTTLPPDWDKVTLENIAREFISGGTPSTKRTEYWDGEIPWTTSAQISEGDLFLESSQRFITKEGLESSASHLVPKGNLLIGTRVGVGKAAVNLIDIAISQDLTGVVLNTTLADGSFLAYQLKTEQTQKFFDGRKRGTTIKGISRFDLASLPLLLPPLPEQRAIARVLRAVQKARELRQKQLALERKLKAALMRHLFTHGTRGAARKQTEIGETPESWQIVRLADIADLFSGGTPSKHRADWWQGEIPWVSPKDLKRMRLWDVKDHISAEALQNGSRLAPAKSIFVVVRGMILAKDFPVAIAEAPMAFNQDIKAIVARSETHPEFLLYAFMQHKASIARFIDSATHGTRRLGTSSLEEMRLPLPSLDEQRKIAKTLCVADNKISALENESVLLDKLFRALLEKLMTGRLSAVPLINKDDDNESSLCRSEPDGQESMEFSL